MLYADGELEGAERAAVEAYLAKNRDARRKLLAMGIVSDVVRDCALGAAADSAGDIADLVMGAIEVEARSEAKQEVAVMAPPPAEKKAAAVPPRRKPANDNARGMWMVAAIAAAAAAGLLLWSRGLSQSTGNGVASGRPPVPSITAPAPHDDVAKAEGPKADGDDDHGVEVAAVDFGARTGAVFYVSRDSAASGTTTVVWLSDDSSGGNE
ncbi:MAG: hypothetical protein QM820_16390 [Minicystis sp.]